MKRLLMPVMALLLIVQSSYLLAAAVDYVKQAKQATQAAAGNRWEEVYKLIDEGVSVDTRGVITKLPLIDTAIVLNKLEAVQELINRDAELNIQADRQPLMFASERYLGTRDNMPIIELLLRSGADPNFESIGGVSTLNDVKGKQSLNPANQATYSARKQELINLFEQIPPAGTHIKGSEE